MVSKTVKASGISFLVHDIGNGTPHNYVRTFLPNIRLSVIHPCFATTTSLVLRTRPNKLCKVAHDLLPLLPDLTKQFMDGKFTVTKNSNPFSAMAIDQAHEQNNKIVKGDGASFIQNYEERHGMSKSKKNRHYETSSSFQSKFQKDVNALISSIEELGSPFEDEGEDLVCLGSKLIADRSACDIVKNIKNIGSEQYQEFV